MIILVFVSLGFITMVYFTFFHKKKPGSKPVGIIRTIENIRTAARIITGSNDKQVLPPSVPKKPDIVAALFQPDIVDIFNPSPEIKKIFVKKEVKVEKEPVIKEKKPAMSKEEKAMIRQALVFKGSVLHGTSAVAIINDAFIHVGDRINGFKVSAISENEVLIDTGEGMIKLEIMKYE